MGLSEEEKRIAFTNEIRSRQKHQYMQKIRYSTLETQHDQSLNNIKQLMESRNFIDEDNFRILCSLIKIGLQDSLVFLGNLIIDGKVSYKMNDHRNQLKIKEGQHTAWFMRILFERNLFVSEYEGILLICLAKRYNDQSLKHTLYLLKHIYKISPQKIPTLIKQKGAISSLKWCCLQGSPELKKLGFSILSLITLQQAYIYQLFNSFPTSYLQQIVISGLLCIQTCIRSLCSQVINNLVISGVILPEVISRILTIGVRQKSAVKRQISYILYNFSCNAEDQQIIKAVKEGLVQVLSEYSENGQQQCRKNVTDASMSLSKRVRESRSAFDELELQLRVSGLYFSDDHRMED